MISNVKKCKYCRFFFLYMPEADGPLLAEKNPEWNIKFKAGQKLCLKRREFKYPDDECGNFMKYN